MNINHTRSIAFSQNFQATPLAELCNSDLKSTSPYQQRQCDIDKTTLDSYTKATYHYTEQNNQLLRAIALQLLSKN